MRDTVQWRVPGLTMWLWINAKPWSIDCISKHPLSNQYLVIIVDFLHVVDWLEIWDFIWDLGTRFKSIFLKDFGNGASSLKSWGHARRKGTDPGIFQRGTSHSEVQGKAPVGDQISQTVKQSVKILYKI